MQLPVAILGCVLVFGSTALTVGDYSNGPVESPERLRLGRFYLTDDALSLDEARVRLNDLGLAGALKVYRPALERDPGSAYRWTDLAGMLVLAGDRTGADYSYRRADHLAPDDANVLFEFADYASGIGDTAGAVQHFSRVLTVAYHDEDKIIVQNVFAAYERLRIRDLGLLDGAIPDARSARLYLTYLTSRAVPAAVRKVWLWMHAKGFDDDANTVTYLRYLFARKQYAAAAEDWRAHLASGAHRLDDGYPTRTAVFNGGFEFASAQSPFDWEFDYEKNVTVTRDDAVHHDGNYSMRIEFSGSENPEFRQVHELAVVTPGRYRIEAFIKTAGLSSSEGMRMMVQSEQFGPILAQTDALKGTNDFTPLSATFEVPAGTPFIEIRLVRHRSLRIDNQLNGKVWLDSVSLTHVQ